MTTIDNAEQARKFINSTIALLADAGFTFRAIFDECGGQRIGLAIDWPERLTDEPSDEDWIILANLLREGSYPSGANQ